MSEKSKKEVHSSILLGLKSNESKVVIDSINQLRDAGELGDILVLVDILLDSSNEEVQHCILKFLADIKEKSAAKIIMDAITDDKYNSIQKELVGICWESSLDFSPYVSVFVDILIHAEFMTSFEAFTVIENFTEKIHEEIKIEEQDKLKDAIPEAVEDRKGILHEAIHLLEQE